MSTITEEERANALFEHLKPGLRVKKDGRVDTDGGDKTPLGLYRTVFREEFLPPLMKLTPKNIQIRIISAEKRTETDSYSGGCELDSARSKELYPANKIYPSVLEAFRDIVKDRTITPDQITTIDPNIYRDSKGGPPTTVKDNTASGNFRCLYDRTENSHGRKPTAQEEEDFKAGKITLKHAVYEIYFNIQITGLGEVELAEFLGVNNW